MKVIIQNARLSFPVLWTPEEYEKGDGKPRYSATVIVESGSENDKLIREAIKEVMDKEFGKDAARMTKVLMGNNKTTCYKDPQQDENIPEGMEGMMKLTAYRREKDGAPKIVNRDKSPLLESDGKPYAGCYVNGVFEIYAQSGKNSGIRGSFASIQFVKDGPAFGGAPATTDGLPDLGDIGDDEVDDMI